jgi:transcription antitermination protein NusB
VGARHKARKRALDILFEADQRGEPIDTVLADRVGRGEPVANPYTQTLVAGVVDHAAEIDELIEANAIDWSLDRMPAVDRALLRLATFELRWGVDLAPAVAIDEAVELAKELSTDESPAFVNGVLGRIATA